MPTFDTARLKIAGIDYAHTETETVDGHVALGTAFQNRTFVGRLELEQRPSARLSGRLGFDGLRREFLPRIPPVSAYLQLDMDWDHLALRPRVDFATRQGRVFREESPTQGWAAFSVEASYVVVRPHVSHMFAGDQPGQPHVSPSHRVSERCRAGARPRCQRDLYSQVLLEFATH